MNYILFDSDCRINLLPLTFMRPVADIRIGILTIRQKWELYLGELTSTFTEEYLQKKFPLIVGKQNVLIDGSVCPTVELVAQIKKLKMGEAITSNGKMVALKTATIHRQIIAEPDKWKKKEYKHPLIKTENTYDIFAKNGISLTEDYKLLAGDRLWPIPKSIIYSGPKENIFIHPGAKIYHAILNAENGPIYIDEDSEIMEGALIRGPFYLGKHSTVKMGAKIYGPTTIGPHSKVGGELNNVVIFGYSNKGHEGFLGNSVIAEWCNIGADTNNSNLKNTYDSVKLWNYAKRSFQNTNLQFCGLIMGDHSKTGINTMFNTGTVVGVVSNVFGSGFNRNFIPSFSWGGPSKMIKHKLERAILTAEQVVERRGIKFDATEREIFTHLFKLSLKDGQL